MLYLKKATGRTVETIKRIYEESDLSGMTKVELQSVCDELGVGRSGTKADLANRILSDTTLTEGAQNVD